MGGKRVLGGVFSSSVDSLKLGDVSSTGISGHDDGDDGGGGDNGDDGNADDFNEHNVLATLEMSGHVFDCRLDARTFLSSHAGTSPPSSAYFNRDSKFFKVYKILLKTGSIILNVARERERWRAARFDKLVVSTFFLARFNSSSIFLTVPIRSNIASSSKSANRFVK